MPRIRSSRRRRRHSLPSALLFLVAGLQPRIPSRPSGERSHPDRLNLLLITLDTTRADHLGCYGYTKAKTPNLDALAREGAMAEHAVAVAPLTLPSHASIMTSLYPPRHGIRDNADFRLPDSERTLAEHLKGLGYGTAAVVASIVLDGRLGLAQGFDTYDEPKGHPGAKARGAAGVSYESLLERPAGQVTDAALATLTRLVDGARTSESSTRGVDATRMGRSDGRDDSGSRPRAPGADRATSTPRIERTKTDSSRIVDSRASANPRTGGAGRPFFLWVHYYDPHADYAPPARIASQFAGRLYDGEIAYMDGEIGRLLDALRRRRILDRTLVVVVADHGESLREHGEASHGLLVYESTLRVPLIVRLPGLVPSSTRIARPLSGVDIAPTLLDLMSQPAMPGVQGTSFASELRRPSKAPPSAGEAEPVYSESLLAMRAYGWSPLYALRLGDLKFIDAPESELYDLREDPGELRNLAARRPQDVDTFRTSLRTMRRRFGSPDAAANRPMDPEERERLASLGYVSTSPSPDDRGRGSAQGATGPSGSEEEASGAKGSDSHPKTRRDPKALVALHEAIVEAKELVSAKRIAQARERLLPVLIEDPRNPAALSLAGTLDFTMGSREGGLERLRAAALAAPEVYENQRNLANALHVVGRLDEAERAYRAALSIRPEAAVDHYALGNVLFARKDALSAIREYQEAIRLGDGGAGVRAALGVALASTGQIKEATSALRKAVEIEDKLGGAWSALGEISEKEGRWDEACSCYGRATAAGSATVEARAHRAFSCRQAGNRAEFDRSAREFLARFPEHSAAPYLRAGLSLDAGDRKTGRRDLEAYLAQPGNDPLIAVAARRELAAMGK